jgi:hypothetical protein
VSSVADRPGARAPAPASTATPKASRRRVLSRVPVPLALLLAVALIQGVTWAAFSPADQGPDEPAHFAYIQYLAETGHKPGANTGHTPSSSEQAYAIDAFGLAPLLGNIAARPAWGPVEREEWAARNREITEAERSNGDGPNGPAQNPPLYYAMQVVPYEIGKALHGDYFDRMLLIRLGNVVFYLVGTAFVWLLGVEVFGRRQWLPTVATSCVVLHPKLASLVGTINTEPLLFLTFTVAMWAAVRGIRRGPTLPIVTVLSLASVAAALTQGRGLAAVPAAILTLALAFLRHRPRLRRMVLLAGLMGAMFAVGLILLVLTTRGTGGAYGGEVEKTTVGHYGFSFKQLIGQTWQFYFPKLGFMTPRLGPAYGYRQVYIETFFGGLYAYEVNVSKSIFDLIQLAAAAGLAWLGVAAIAKRNRLRRSWHAALALLGFLFAELALVHWNSYKQLLVGTDPIITGRYLVAVIALFGLAIAFCVGSLPRRAGAVAGALIIAGMLALQVGELGITIVRFYA